jgi:hypothetical protein
MILGLLLGAASAITGKTGRAAADRIVTLKKSLE